MKTNRERSVKPDKRGTVLWRNKLKTVLTESFRWSNDGSLNITPTLISWIGMVGPIGYGLFFNNLRFGLLASLGALFMSTNAVGLTIKKRMMDLLIMMVTGAAAIFTGALVERHGWLTVGIVVILSVIAALLGGMGRIAARTSVQFTIFMVIGTGFGAGGRFHLACQLAFQFAIGSAWAMMVSVLFILLLKSAKIEMNAAQTARAIPFKRRFSYWRHTLTHFYGWQYPIRIGVCMGTAEAIGIGLDQERSYWISLTVAIVLHRYLSTALARTFQRGIGTVAGVLLGSLLLLGSLHQAAIVMIAGCLAALRPIFKNRNYMIYSMLMTPLMVVMFSVDGIVTKDMLFDRLLDTIIGCIISLVLGYIIWPNKKNMERKRQR